MSVRVAAGPPVAVFDIDLPPGIAFLRSLGRAGIPTVGFSSKVRAAGRFSRHVSDIRPCPPVLEVDDFTGWLEEEMACGRIELVAPTSDWVAFSAAAARSSLGLHRESEASLESVVDCLLKPRFAKAMVEVGFPTPRWETPRTATDAVAAGARLGYPLVLKMRSHVGLGRDRGVVVRSEEELLVAFSAYQGGTGQRRVLEHDPDLALPVMQAYVGPDRADLISISGCFGPDGELLAVGHSRKLHQFPEEVGIGTIFEAVDRQPFTDRAVEAVRKVLGKGIFELEVLVDREDPDRYWAIDLNPRAFGQITLDIANGRDLPLLWYRSVSGQATPAEVDLGGRQRRYWHGAPFFTGVAVRVAVGPDRVYHLREVRKLLSLRHVGSIRSWSDPLPSLVHWFDHLRHPGALVRPHLERRRSRRSSSRGPSSHDDR